MNKKAAFQRFIGALAVTVLTLLAVSVGAGTPAAHGEFRATSSLADDSQWG
ncbi:hypothetical protein [Streptomyces sp. NPDC054887]